MRRVCSSGWWRRWRGVVWCCVCLVLLALLAIWDTLGYLLASEDNRNRHCPPSPVEVDGCSSWRPLEVVHPTCSCTRKILVLHDTCTDFVPTDSNSYLTYTREYFGSSHCSDQATLRGPRQHVVSLSIDQITSYDLATLNYTIQKANSAYKGWLIRVYTPRANHTHPGLCALVCANANVDLCETKGMSKPPKVATPQGRTGWRWAVLGDPLVSVWVVRYTDLEILERESHAVTQFINSDKCWHLMKDHPSQAKSDIGSGLLGGKTSWGLNELRRIRHRLTNSVHSIGDEETILEDTIVPVMGNDVMIHDSITCQRSSESVPYPSKRNPGQWVGMPSRSLYEEQLVIKSATTHNQKPKPSGIITKKPLMLQKLAESGSATAKSKLSSVSSAKDVKMQQHHSGLHSIVQGQDKQEESKFEHKIQSSLSLAVTTKASVKDLKVPKESKPLSRSMYLSQEREHNQEKGIIECPRACRPHHHPDWQYC